MNQVTRADDLARYEIVEPRGNIGQTGRRKGRAETRSPRSIEAGRRATPGFGFPHDPLTLMASDVADLECDKPARAIKSLVELCRSFGRKEILILNLEYLAIERWEDAACRSVDMSRVRMLRSVIRETCRLMNISAPVIDLEERDQSFDMRISLGACA